MGPGIRRKCQNLKGVSSKAELELASDVWNLAIPDIGFLPDVGSPNDTISGHVSRDRGFLLSRYRDMSDVTRYRVPMSGTHPISGHHVNDIVNHIPDIRINIGYNIGCPDIGNMTSRYWCQYWVPISGHIISRYLCQYRVPISDVPISGYEYTMIATDIVVNIGHDIGSQPESALHGHSLHYVPD